ncbi:hypothetical protein [Butyrivibrio sp. XBB1001]|uniref:hypothetical protein n=1 Tax=Butyrivibrio sp. XBB1001 TaxID=1280682 RepID=UPI0004257D81|nr:hypothetical protein [Butyrivibrio sp. XBB1001]
MQNYFLLDPVKFKIEQAIEDEDKNAQCCKKLIEEIKLLREITSGEIRELDRKLTEFY